jgi:hypothetical protein
LNQFANFVFVIIRAEQILFRGRTGGRIHYDALRRNAAEIFPQIADCHA